MLDFGGVLKNSCIASVRKVEVLINSKHFVTSMAFCLVEWVIAHLLGFLFSPYCL